MKKKVVATQPTSASRSKLLLRQLESEFGWVFSEVQLAGWGGSGIKMGFRVMVYKFKVKGTKHSVSKVKTLASVDTEMVENINELIENTVTENRLLQGISWLKENSKSIDQKSTGDFLRWVVNDIIKEETDTIVKNCIDPKKFNSIASNKARMWYFNYLNVNI